MTTAFRHAAPTAIGTQPTHLRAPVWTWMLAAAILLGALVGLSLVLRPTPPNVQDLPADVRAALYERTRADLGLCATTAGMTLRDHCRDQAAFIVTFPECDEACQTLASRWTARQPAR